MGKPTRRGSEALRLSGWKRQELRSLFLRQHPLCRDCERDGRVTEATQLDHIVALEAGGSWDWDNLQGLCKPCHDAKTRRERGLGDKGCDVNGNPNGGWKA